MPPHVTGRAGYRPDIDGLRAVAVLAVVGFHAFPRWVPGGFVGVDVFFVISGYLISTIILEGLAEGRFSFAHFYARRLRRIFPALILVMGACYVAGRILLLPGELAQLGKHIAGGAAFASNLVLWSESGYFDNAAATKPLLHLWSLGIEEQFYLFWPLLLWLAWKAGRGRVVAVIAAAGLFSFGANVAFSITDPLRDFYSPDARLWELVAGAALAHRAVSGAMVQREPSAVAGMCSLAGALLVGAAVLVLTATARFPGWWALLPVLGTVLIIYAGPSAWLNRAILSRRWLVGIGLVSYPLYLWHWPLLVFARIVEGGTPSAAVRIGAVVIAGGLALLTYLVIERPIRFGLPRRSVAAGLAAAMLATGIVGFHAFANRGLPERFPPLVQEIDSIRYDHTLPYREGTCFLRPEQSFADFTSCETVGSAGLPRLLLWGDSHAAHLYPGYRENYAGAFSVVQRTASGCPPILGLVNPVRPHCRDINDAVFAEIGRNPPARVVLAANWVWYDWPAVEATITRLRGAGVRAIDLVGPVPQWSESLPRQLFIAFKADPLHRVPARLKQGIKSDGAPIDAALAAMAARTGATYLSPLSALCDASGCLATVGDALMVWDDQHMTEAGSRFLVAQLGKARERARPPGAAGAMQR